MSGPFPAAKTEPLFYESPQNWPTKIQKTSSPVHLKNHQLIGNCCQSWFLYFHVFSLDLSADFYEKGDLKAGIKKYSANINCETFRSCESASLKNQLKDSTKFRDILACHDNTRTMQSNGSESGVSENGIERTGWTVINSTLYIFYNQFPFFHFSKIKKSILHFIFLFIRLLLFFFYNVFVVSIRI